jgi:hypothetical protein
MLRQSINEPEHDCERAIGDRVPIEFRLHPSPTSITHLSEVIQPHRRNRGCQGCRRIVDPPAAFTLLQPRPRCAPAYDGGHTVGQRLGDDHAEILGEGGQHKYIGFGESLPLALRVRLAVETHDPADFAGGEVP